MRPVDKVNIQSPEARRQSPEGSGLWQEGNKAYFLRIRTERFSKNSC